MDITDELRRLVSELNDRGVDYALCGGMAMAVHGIARTTIDIDLLIPAESLAAVFSIAASFDYNVRGMDMSLGDGAVEIRRVSKIDPVDGELLSLDLLLVTPQVLGSWQTRIAADWEGLKLWVVSRQGLVDLKELRRSDLDLVDIKALKGVDS
jgi:hypothetical protein